MESYKNRSEVPEKYKWDLSSFFQNEAEYLQCFKKLENKIKTLDSYQNCVSDAHKMYEFLTLQTEMNASFEDLYAYAYLINDQELGISSNIERKAKNNVLYNELSSKSCFFAPSLLKLTKEEYDKLFQTEPKLLEFKSDLDMIYREKQHILKEQEEQMIGDLVNALDEYENISSNLLNKEIHYGTIIIDGKKVEITTTNYRKLMKNQNQSIRKEVHQSFLEKRKQYSQTCASLLNGYITLESTCAKLHHYKSSWDAKLFSLNLSDKVYKTLVKVTEENLDVLQKYYRLMKKSLNLETLHSYDLFLEMNQNEKEYSIEEGISLIRKSLNPLGKKYLEKFEKVITNRYIDFCGYPGKFNGGYSLGTTNQDSRILMSFHGDVDSISTITHEIGHNVNGQYIKENNPKQYCDSPHIVAEVASLLNECLLSSYLAEFGNTKEEKLAGINNILKVIVSNLFGAVQEGKMEELMYEHVHNGGSITSDFLNQLNFSSLQKYYGNTVEMNELDSYAWTSRTHYYNNFYLYCYAICICVASSVAQDILNQKEGMVEKYLKFLTIGGDKWPQEFYETLGVNLEEETVYKKAIEYFNSLLEKYEKILNEEVK